MWVLPTQGQMSAPSVPAWLCPPIPNPQHRSNSPHPPKDGAHMVGASSDTASCGLSETLSSQ